jgi:outer membrane protein assembly factor BamB
MGWSPFRQTGLTHYAPAECSKGYTLVTPLGGDSTYLLDMAGRIVHRWRFEAVRSNYARLLENGRLLALAVDASLPPRPGPPIEAQSFEQAIRRLGANATHLVELDWDSNLVWQYENPAIHHDFVRLSNGNTLLPLTIELPDDLRRLVRGGQRHRGHPGFMLADDILEVDRDGREVRRIHLWRLLDPVRDPICRLEHRLEWTHVNGLDVTPAGDVFFSCRENSRVGIIDSAGGKLLWKYGAPEISHQHHPSFLANGNLQIFDNGHHAQGFSRSRVIEVNVGDSSIVWQYVADPPFQFYSSHISSAQRLPGGSVLICEGSSGRVFEVTQRGNVVWEWINPFAFRVNGVLTPNLFRAHRYTPDDPALSDRELDPARYKELNVLYGL